MRYGEALPWVMEEAGVETEFAAACSRLCKSAMVVILLMFDGETDHFIVGLYTAP